MDEKVVRIGSRESELAVAQSKIVIDAIHAFDPSIQCKLITMKTTGDKLLDSPLQEIGGKGLFIKELDHELINAKVDICVHSFKDMPALENPLLPIAALSPREDPRDALVLPKGKTMLHKGARIGCSSMSRKVQLEVLYPGCKVVPVRGNVLSRITKLDYGQYDALVLASAGLRRLGLENRISILFPVSKLLPASCQGIIAVQCLRGENVNYLQNFHSMDSWDASVAERSFLYTLGADCTAPVGAYAEIQRNVLTLRGMIVGKNGSIHKAMGSGKRERAMQTGVELATRLRDEADREDRNG